MALLQWKVSTSEKIYIQTSRFSETGTVSFSYKKPRSDLIKQDTSSRVLPCCPLPSISWRFLLSDSLSADWVALRVSANSSQFQAVCLHSVRFASLLLHDHIFFFWKRESGSIQEALTGSVSNNTKHKLLLTVVMLCDASAEKVPITPCGSQITLVSSIMHSTSLQICGKHMQMAH